MTSLTLPDAASRVSMTPLELLVRCSLHGIPCDGGMIDEEFLPAVGSVRVAPADEIYADGPEPDDESDADRRERVVRRVVEKLVATGKYWPSRIEKRSTARGLGGSDVGLALRGVEVLLDCRLLLEEVHGGHEPRVGLDRGRRQEIQDIAEGRPILVDELREWIDHG